ncbi:MAG: hypothetical protein E7379_02885 [Clostridiales bacterium]|nr:hypothetical protein [Spirochaetaceae bacterium]MBE7074015.1 hypothetical protein [Clostridiales bacterium]
MMRSMLKNKVIAILVSAGLLCGVYYSANYIQALPIENNDYEKVANKGHEKSKETMKSYIPYATLPKEKITGEINMKKSKHRSNDFQPYC